MSGRLLVDRDHTLLAGSSLGGLISAYAGLRQAAVWGRLGVLSPSSWWDGRFLAGAVAAASGGMPHATRLYVDSGSPDDDTDDTKELTQKYRDVGYRDGVDLMYVVEPGGQHNEDAWARRLPAALRFLTAGW